MCFVEYMLLDKYIVVSIRFVTLEQNMFTSCNCYVCHFGNIYVHFLWLLRLKEINTILVIANLSL